MHSEGVKAVGSELACCLSSLAFSSRMPPACRREGKVQQHGRQLVRVVCGHTCVALFASAYT